MRMKHFIITRFNIPFTGYAVSTRRFSQSFDINILLDPKYLDYRFDLFEKTAYSSLANQTIQDFEWIILFYDKTPSKYKQRIGELVKKHSNMHPVFLSYDEAIDYQKILSKTIDDLVTDQTIDYVLSTRIDNDDLFHPDFVKWIRQDITSCVETDNIQLDENIEVVFSYPNGIHYSVQTKYLSRYQYPKNHFISLLSIYKKDETNQILSYNHTMIDKLGIRVIYFSKKEPVWCECVHNSNYANVMDIKLSNIVWNYKDASTLYEQFGLLPSSKLNYYVQTGANVLLIPIRGLIRKIKQKTKNIVKGMKSRNR